MGLWRAEEMLVTNMAVVGRQTLFKYRTVLVNIAQLQMAG
jgi:hypothetical protein